MLHAFRFLLCWLLVYAHAFSIPIGKNRPSWATAFSSHVTFFAEMDGVRHELRFDRNDDARILTDNFARAHKLSAEYQAVLLAEIQRLQAEGGPDGTGATAESETCSGGQCTASAKHKMDINFPRHRSCLDEAVWNARKGVTVDGDLIVEVGFKFIRYPCYPHWLTHLSTLRATCRTSWMRIAIRYFASGSCGCIRTWPKV
jgi:hypothetical protein